MDCGRTESKIMPDKAKDTAKAKKSPVKRTESPPKPTKKAVNPGNFKKGNTAGTKTRNPAQKRKLGLAEAFKAAITAKDVKDVAAAMLKEATKGNVKAAQLLLDRCCGKVKEEVTLSLSGDTQDFLDYMGENYGGLPG